MEYRFFLGSAELILHTDEEIVHQQWDAVFLNPVMEPRYRIDITLEIVSELSVPSGEGILSQRSRTWYTDEGVYRLYHVGKKHAPYILSHYVNPSAITLYVLQDEWERKKHSFRFWFYIHLEDILLENRALVLHSASIIRQGKAILFTAPSGTGKTTQTDLWHRFRDGVADLNGDRTLLQKTERGWYGCGFPVFGSTVRCEQAAAPIGAIVIVRQAPSDGIRELSLVEKVSWLYSETTVMSQVADNIHKSMDLLEDLATNVRILLLDCTMNESAVDTLEQAIFGE